MGKGGNPSTPKKLAVGGPMVNTRQPESDADMTVFGDGTHNYPIQDATSGGRNLDFIWSDYQEPHAERKRAIIKKYGRKITSLFGPSWKTKYCVLFVVTLHVTLAYLLRDMTWSWQFWLVSYVLGGMLTQNLFLAIHEITHNLAFRDHRLNKLLAIFANLPICIPYSGKFPGYHHEHHRYQGVDGIDTDVPTPAEAWLLRKAGFPGKLFFAVFQIFFYALRPMFVRHNPLDFWFLLNVAVQFAFDAALYKYCGMGAIWYLLMSAFFSGSLHPCAAHFIAEHYVFLGDIETYSYYGWLNIFSYNVGYHNEHHDFPYVAWDKLPQVRAIASDFYDNLPYHRSWPQVIYEFLVHDNMSSFSRVKRSDVTGLAAIPMGSRRSKIASAPSVAKSKSRKPSMAAKSKKKPRSKRTKSKSRK